MLDKYKMSTKSRLQSIFLSESDYLFEYNIYSTLFVLWVQFKCSLKCSDWEANVDEKLSFNPIAN